jgi:signal transduction histidine kinase
MSDLPASIGAPFCPLPAYAPTIDNNAFSAETIIACFPSAVLVYDCKSDRIHMNNRAIECLGLIPVNIPQWTALSSECPALLIPLLEILRSPETDIPRSQVTIPSNSAEGELVLGFCLKTLESSDHNQLKILVFNDITDLIKQRIAVEKLTEELYQSKKLASLGVLVSGVAHELNNPLTGLSMSCQLAKKALKPWDKPGDDALPPRLVKAIHQVLEELEQMEGTVGKAGVLVRELLDYARPQQQMDVTTLDLGHMISQLIRQLKLNVEYSLMEFRHSPPTDSIIVRGNYTKLEQVFFNLLRNAKDATGGKGSVVIDYSTDAESQTVTVSVSDNGPGIDKTMMDHIFDPFYTTKGPSGVGLGLSISFRTIEQHGGRLSVGTGSLGGASFQIQLPLITAEGGS